MPLSTSHAHECACEPTRLFAIDSSYRVPAQRLCLLQAKLNQNVHDPRVASERSVYGRLLCEGERPLEYAAFRSDRGEVWIGELHQFFTLVRRHMRGFKVQKTLERDMHVVLVRWLVITTKEEEDECEEEGGEGGEEEGEEEEEDGEGQADGDRTAPPTEFLCPITQDLMVDPVRDVVLDSASHPPRSVTADSHGAPGPTYCAHNAAGEHMRWPHLRAQGNRALAQGSPDKPSHRITAGVRSRHPQHLAPQADPGTRTGIGRALGRTVTYSRV